MKRLLFFLLPLLLGGSAATKAAPPSPPPQVTVTDVRLSEGNKGRQNASFRVSLSKTSATTAYVGIMTDNVTARAGSDYIATSKTLSFAPGTRTQTFLVPIVGDTVFEPNETFVIRINAKGYASRARAAICTIRNDDAAPRPTATPKPRPTATLRPLPTATAKPQPTATPRPLPTATTKPGPTATATPYSTATPQPTATPYPTATPQPTATATPQPTSTPAPAPVRAKGKIVFSGGSNTFSGLWVINADGSNLTQISALGGGRPRWSPDGSKICFASGFVVYVINADGSGRSRVSPENNIFYSGTWSPDGNKILLTGSANSASSSSQTFSLSVVNADGSEFHHIDFIGVGADVRWSPDSKRLLWTDTRAGNGQIYVANADGSEQTNLSRNSLREGSASWSADGSRILYSSLNIIDGENNWAICTMNADGSNKIVIRDHMTNGWNPGWSPDGQKISLTDSAQNHVRPYYGFYIMNSDGSNLLDLSQFAPSDWNPRWSPDSQKLAFPIISRGVYTLNADGSQPVQLKSGSSGNYGPMWSPDGATVGWLAWGNGFYSHIFIANADGSGQIDITPSPSQSAADFDWTNGFIPPTLSSVSTSPSAPAS